MLKIIKITNKYTYSLLTYLLSILFPFSFQFFSCLAAVFAEEFGDFSDFSFTSRGSDASNRH